MPKTYYYTQEVLFQTELFGKTYFWMKDVDGTIWLAKAKPVEGASIDGATGDKTVFTERLVPDLT